MKGISKAIMWFIIMLAMTLLIILSAYQLATKLGAG